MSEATNHESQITNHESGTNHESRITNHETPDEPYIRDVSASVGLAVRLGSMNDAAMLCEGEKLFCEYCGAEFPLWPTCGWASHMSVAHSADLTIQTVAAFAMFCADEFNTIIQHWLWLQFMSRVSIRRRARDLNMLQFVPRPDSKLIVDA
jgi:hypothetical protein